MRRKDNAMTIKVYCPVCRAKMKNVNKEMKVMVKAERRLFKII
jgi:hypothetical protein